MEKDNRYNSVFLMAELTKVLDEAWSFLWAKRCEYMNHKSPEHRKAIDEKYFDPILKLLSKKNKQILKDWWEVDNIFLDVWGSQGPDCPSVRVAPAI